MAGGYINWKPYVNSISEAAWGIADGNERLAAVKAELRALGANPAKVDKVTTAAMNAAYNRNIDEAVKKRIDALRAANGGGARKRAARNNAAAANVLGLGAGGADLNLIDDGEDDEIMDNRAPFSVAVEMIDRGSSDSFASLSFVSPSVRVVMKPASHFDVESCPLLMAVVPTPGDTVVGEPILLSSSSEKRQVELTVCQTFSNDMLENLYPETHAQVGEEFLNALQLEQNYGKHFDYGVLNRMAQEIAPSEVSWTISLDIEPPYYIKDEESITLMKSDEANMCYILIKLEHIEASREVKRARRIEIHPRAPLPAPQAELPSPADK